MATQSGRKETALSERLRQEPWRFDFFQAVRLLEFIEPERKPVGYDFPSDQEIVRFRALLSRSFPAAPIARIDTSPDEMSAPQMQVSFMGLAGPAGVLPEGYLDLLLQRLRDRDFALRDFLDLFNHRTISLFYRAWEKYRFPFSFERIRRRGEAVDPFTGCLQCLVGIGTGHQRHRQPIPDDLLLRYAGHFARYPRSAVVLETMLTSFLQVPVEVVQFLGRWLALDEEQRSRLPAADCPDGQFNQLGRDLVIGAQVWDVQSSLGLRLGPMSRRVFGQLLPGGIGMQQLISLARIYAGPELDFEVQLVLAADEVPGCRLQNGKGAGSQLGWNSWLCSHPSAMDRDDARFWSGGLLADWS